MECCGDAFAVGDTIALTLVESPDTEWLDAAIGPTLAARITHAEEHHEVDAGAVSRRGRVLSIRCAYSQFARSTPGGRTLYPVAGSARLRPRDRVDGTEGGDAGDLRFNGYVVGLDLELLQQ